jgi:hypothetical protein
MLLVKLIEQCTFAGMFDIHSSMDEKSEKSKVVPVIGRGGLWGCEVLRVPHCLDNQLTDGGKVVSPTYWPQFTRQKHYLSVSGTHFC